MKKIVFALAALLAIPFVSFAATYHYIDIQGKVNTIEAPTPQAALQMADATGRVLHSGVKLDSGDLKTGEVYAQTYLYVSTTGELKSVQAATADGAELLASDKAANSGFLVTAGK